MKKLDLSDESDASLVLGGPLYQLLLRSRLTTPTMGLVHRRILAALIITWLPLALLSAFDGHFAYGVGVAFLSDLDVHTKFILSVPLLIAAELMVHQRVKLTVRQFGDTALIAPGDQPRFDAILRSTWRLRNSVLVEVALLVVAFTFGHWLWSGQSALKVATWYASPDPHGTHYTWAGYWYVFVSLPIARFILLRWYFRLLLWYVFMWRVSRMKLQINPLHPDRAGGLGFLGRVGTSFTPILMAQTVLLAGMIGNQVLHEGARLQDFQMMIVTLIVFLMLLVLVPPGFFLLQLTQAKFAALRQYDLLGSRYVNAFGRKWYEKGTGDETQLLGSGDIQSLADLANAYEVIRQMRPVPVDRRIVLQLAILLVLPIVPLTLTLIPLEQIVGRILKVLL